MHKTKALYYCTLLGLNTRRHFVLHVQLVRSWISLYSVPECYSCEWKHDALC